MSDNDRPTSEFTDTNRKIPSNIRKVMAPLGWVLSGHPSSSDWSPWERSTAGTSARCEVGSGRINARQRTQKTAGRQTSRHCRPQAEIKPLLEGLAGQLPRLRAGGNSRLTMVLGIDLTANLGRRFACSHALIRRAFLFRPLSFSSTSLGVLLLC